MSHIKFDSAIRQNSVQEKIVSAKVEKFSDAVTTILRTEAASKSKKLVYVFINVRQLSNTNFNYTIDDSRDTISESTRASIHAKFEEVFEIPA